MSAQRQGISHEQVTDFVVGLRKESFALRSMSHFPLVRDHVAGAGWYVFARALDQGLIEPDMVNASPAEGLPFRLTKKGEEMYAQRCLEVLPSGIVVQHLVILDRGRGTEQRTAVADYDELEEVIRWYRAKPGFESPAWLGEYRRDHTLELAAEIEMADSTRDIETSLPYGMPEYYPKGSKMYKGTCEKCPHYLWFSNWSEVDCNGWCRLSYYRLRCHDCSPDVC